MSGEKRVDRAIGCESCHGPGSAHVDDPRLGNIFNAGRIDPRRETEICLQCHMRNRDKRLETTTIDKLFGDVRDYPLGYEPGRPLVDYKLPAPFVYGRESKEFYGNGAAKKNRTQGNEFVRSAKYRHGITCRNCHDPHQLTNTKENSQGNELCLKCHQFGSILGPHQSNLEAHTRHRPESTGSLCIECHMPKTGRHLKSSPLTVRTHLFGFIYPDQTGKFGVPNGCNPCHQDQSLEWSEEFLKKWGMTSWEKN